MARFKHYAYEQTKMIPLRFADQIQPRTFEYTLNHVVDNELDLSVFESRNERDTKHTPNYMDSMKSVKNISISHLRSFKNLNQK